MSYQSTPTATRPASRANTPPPQGSDGLARVAGLPSVAASTPLTREQYVSTAKSTEEITRDVASTERYMDGIFAADHAAYASAFEAGRRYTNSYIRSTESKINSRLQVVWSAITALQGQVEELEKHNLQLDEEKYALEKRVLRLERELEDV